MNGFESKKASRGNVRPIIGVYGESGTGKSMSALLLARGLVGPSGNIQQIDSEEGRGELYSDVIPGGYNTIRLSEPYSPARYIEAITFAEFQNADVIVLDQASSEWEGAAGVLDMAAQNEQEGKRGLSVWKQPKMEHAKFIQKLLRAKCPVIVCLRAKFKSRQVKQNGRTEIVKDDSATAIQADEFLFELTAHGMVNQDHSFSLTKISHPSLKSCFPSSGPITIQHGELLAKWCNNPGTNPTTDRSSGKSPDGIADSRALKSKLWSITRQIHQCPDNPTKADKDVCARKLQAWLWDESIISDTETLADLHNGRLAEVVDRVEFKLNNPPTP